MKSIWNNVQQWYHVGQRHVWFEYAALTILILLPIFLPGYILTLDMVFTPHMPWPAELTNTYLFDVLLWLLNQILPGDVLQKIILFSILLLAGVGTHLLTRQLSRSISYWQVAAYFAGIFYMINPFIYARLMAGQWQVLLGYALLPFLVLALIRLLDKPSWKASLWVAVWMIAILVASVHFVGILFIILSLFLVAGVAKYWKQRGKIWQFTMRLLAASLATLVLSSYWIVPAFLGGKVGEIATRAGDAQFSAFATHSGPLGPVGEVLRLQGFWAEARELFVLPQNVMPLWGLLVLVLWVLVILGAVQLWRINRPIALVMIGSIVAGVALATSPLMQWLSGLFPLLGGYREPHKFAILVVLAFSVLAAFGTLYLVGKRKHKKIWAAACLALPLVITPTMFWAGGGQLWPVDYPKEWYALNQQLKDNVPPSKKVLFLPWHMYAPYSFSNGRIIANPAEKFFQVPTIISDDPEFADIAPNRHDPARQQLAILLEEHPQNISQRLQDLSISHVVLAKEQEWQEYDFLGQLPILYENDKLIVYEVQP